MKETLHLVETVSNMQLRVDSARFRHRVFNNMRHAIADKIVTIGIIEKEDTYSTSFRMDLVVIDENAYWKDVKEAAEEMLRYLR